MLWIRPTRNKGSCRLLLVERGPFLESCRLAERVLPARTTDVSRVHLLVQADGDTCTLHALGSWPDDTRQSPETVVAKRELVGGRQSAVPHFPKRGPMAMELGPWPTRRTKGLRFSSKPSTPKTAMRWA